MLSRDIKCSEESEENREAGRRKTRFQNRRNARRKLKKLRSVSCKFQKEKRILLNIDNTSERGIFFAS